MGKITQRKSAVGNKYQEFLRVKNRFNGEPSAAVSFQFSVFSFQFSVRSYASHAPIKQPAVGADFARVDAEPLQRPFPPTNHAGSDDASTDIPAADRDHSRVDVGDESRFRKTFHSTQYAWARTTSPPVYQMVPRNVAVPNRSSPANRPIGSPPWSSRY